MIGINSYKAIKNLKPAHKPVLKTENKEPKVCANILWKGGQLTQRKRAAFHCKHNELCLK